MAVLNEAEEEATISEIGEHLYDDERMIGTSCIIVFFFFGKRRANHMIPFRSFLHCGCALGGISCIVLILYFLVVCRLFGTASLESVASSRL